MDEQQLRKFSDGELKALANRIKNSAKHYKSSRDGSYEMALSKSGYYLVMDEIERRKEL